MKYFVSYKYWMGYLNPNEFSGEGRTSIERDKPISSIESIENIEQSIMEARNDRLNKENKSKARVNKILILNWQRFEKEFRDDGISLAEQGL